MAKPKRGRSLWKMPARGRGTCPICQANRIKLLYTGKSVNGDVIKVCKRCNGKAIAQ